METTTLINNFVLVNRIEDVHSLRPINPTSESISWATLLYKRGKGPEML